MKITEITGENIDYFIGGLGFWWEERTDDMLFLGLLDDSDSAAAALAVRIDGQTARLRHIAVDGAKRRLGYGSHLLEALCALLRPAGIVDLQASLFFEQPTPQLFPPDTPPYQLASPPPNCLLPEEQSVALFLAKNGFSFFYANLCRNTYCLSDLNPRAFYPSQKPSQVRDFADLSLRELMSLAAAAEHAEEGAVPSSLTSAFCTDPTDTYSRFWVEGDTVSAMVHCFVSAGSLYVDAIYARPGKMPLLPALYAAALGHARQSLAPETPVLVDLFGSRLQRYAQTLIPCAPKKTAGGYIARRTLHETGGAAYAER